MGAGGLGGGRGRPAERGFLAEDGSLTRAGVAGRAHIEMRTDEAAERPWTALGTERSARLAELLEPLARTVEHSGLLPPGNPVGLTRRESAGR
ncbi:hypothetical protein O1M54_47470 [Streptomyces diastatochromogenes]|nr:hypothetical protein [Streptomyces diastatochromogenes]